MKKQKKIVLAYSGGLDIRLGSTGLTGLTNPFGELVFNSAFKWLVMLAPLGIVIYMSFGIRKMSVSKAQGTFWIFAALMGASLASIFIFYTQMSIARVFFITAGTFGAMSIYGYTTKRDLTKLGSFLMMGLIGIIIASVKPIDKTIINKKRTYFGALEVIKNILFGSKDFNILKLYI